MHRAHVDQNWIEAWQKDKDYPLPKEVQKRFLNVLRIKTDEKVGVFDGQGSEIIGILSKNLSQQSFFAEAKLSIHLLPSPQIILLQSALEESKLSETIKRGTEFGIDQFIIFPAHRSEPFLYDKLYKRLDRLNAIAIDASRQSGRVFVPKISFSKLLPTVNIGFYGSLKSGTKKLSELCKYILNKDAKEIFLAVGPEGGFSDDEEKVLEKNKWQKTIWAPFTLRSELASLGALAIIQAYLGRA